MENSWRKIMRNVLLFVFTILAVPELLAKTPVTVILNSDSSIKKYEVINAAFKSKYNGKTYQINLDDHDESQIKHQLKNQQPELIFCIGTSAYRLASKYSRQTPIIFSLGLNWQQLLLTKKTYVLASKVPPINNLFMFNFFFPEVKKIGLLYGKKHNKKWYKNVAKQAQKIGLQIIGIPVTQRASINAVMKKQLQLVDAIWLTADYEVLSSKSRVSQIFQLSDAYKKPVFTYSKAFTKFGASFIVAPDIRTLGGQAAIFAHNIQANKKIESTVEYPAGTYLAINLTKLKAYQIKVNEMALSTVNDYIEK